VKLDDGLRGVSRLGFDTAPLIYLVELHPRYRIIVQEVVRRITDGHVNGIISVVTLSEVLVLPIRQGDQALRRRYRDILLGGTGFQISPIEVGTAERAAELRARHRIPLPDALQLATALSEGCEAFLTNDRQLARVTDLRVLVLDDLEL